MVGPQNGFFGWRLGVVPFFFGPLGPSAKQMILCGLSSRHFRSPSRGVLLWRVCVPLGRCVVTTMLLVPVAWGPDQAV